ncbi:hypothetical protein LWI29_030217 [Acer saccharum]|uniref:RNase H type-1 domain-containing protein n=1 Tax=Acer saccharum TaxID=4024 RepID=A0AA39W7C4_ACESA|nr:hypothetical protein LWI29_030217 [Acer saccharum]
MEKLSHLIQQKLSVGDWKPIRISRGGPAISHLFFADDLILFGHASVQQANIMKECLDVFCDLSGQQVSFPKSRVHCSKNVTDHISRALAATCGSPITNDLGNYLGVPLIHGRITKGTYAEIVEKTHKRLASWKSASLSFVGRCTLIKAVTSAIPVYAMQSIKLPLEICSKLDKINRDFLWGSSVDSKKIHLVNWDTVCLPRNLGGLGIKKTKKVNQALLAKVGWWLAQADTGLWGALLKNKYLKGERLSVSDIGTDRNCSSTWRGFNFGAKLLPEGVLWRVGNGHRICFWTDIWIHDLGRLDRFASPPLAANRVHDKVSDYLDANGWDLQKLSSALPWSVVHRIFSIHIGGNRDVEDTIIWGLTKSGEFSVQSAYAYQFSDCGVVPWKWNFIWSLKLPPRVLHFLWTFLHSKLLTNDMRATRGITDDTTCDRCKGGYEDLDHVFRGCRYSIAVWEDIGKGSTLSNSYKGEWSQWLEDNLKCSTLHLGRVPGYLIFAVTLWFIWKWRCDKVFNPSFQVPRGPGQIVWSYAADWLASNSGLEADTGLPMRLISWSPPPLGWVKLNIDGSFNRDLGSISAGGVIRDDRKLWLTGFAVNKGLGSVLEAELWGIFEGLKLAWYAGFRKVLVESDSQSAVSILTNAIPFHHPLFHIVRACKSLLDSDWSCSIHHIYRESNFVADSLARLGHSLGLGVTVFDEPPLQTYGVLEDDYKGVATPRFVSSS